MKYNVSIQEQFDAGAKWLYGIEADSPEGAVDPALSESMRHGYPVGPAVVRVWSEDCQGSTVNHTPLCEVVS